MQLVADWVMPYRGINDVQRGRNAQCRVRVYEDLDTTECVVVLEEVEDNKGESIALAAEVVVGTLMEALSKSLDLSVYRAPIFICHYPPQITGSSEAYELATFEELEVSETVVEVEHDSSQQGGASSRIAIPTVGEATFIPVEPEMVRLVLGGYSRQ